MRYRAGTSWLQAGFRAFTIPNEVSGGSRHFSQKRAVIPDKPQSGADPESIEGRCSTMASGSALRLPGMTAFPERARGLQSAR
ncbi:hypothetical protein BOSEA31B_10908 [Hyphomicrobiales bacterium]|nr:hypothetical protein BOSEA31B_10908 [Hyphomicrobiales bacterium]CAH1700760.1 hypothetical protein BOSEA1005_20459 [Hyphomicrobiales bacterium]CAI0344633.1 hypothetical protein BO1005MUT1_340050 [Hyphomicrobiales bacterium]